MKQKFPEPSVKKLPPADAAALQTLRGTIDTLDRRMVALLAERKHQVDQVITLKEKHHLPVHHPAREEDLISDRRRQGLEAGLNPDLVEELFRRILRASREEQAAEFSRKGVRPDATVLLVGAGGGMGRYFHKWFSDAGYKVRGMGSRDWHRIDELCEGIDLAVISVPIDLTPSVIERLAPHLPPECVLTDLTSIKTAPMKAMLSSHQGPVVGLHPLFGPSTTTMDKQIVVVTPGRDPSACKWVTDQLAAWGAIPMETSAEEHDDIMAVVQSLRHFATFSFGRFLWQKRVDLKRSVNFSSPIYRLELGMVGRLFAQDAHLYSEIIFASPERRTLLKDFIASLNESIHMLDTGDKALFNLQFKKIAEWFGPFGEQAMRESSFLIDKLIERF